MPRPVPIIRRPRPRRGFTLVELLTVIAIIGILVGILVPTIGTVLRKNRYNRSKTLFTNIAMAFESYKEQYGRYPIFNELSAQSKPWENNPHEIDYTFLFNDDKSLLRQVLMNDAAYQITANAPGATNYNRLKIPFLHVDDSLLSRDPPGSDEDPLLVDGFGNPNIGVVIHVGTAHEIDKNAFVKGVSDPDGNGPLVPKVVRNIPLTIVLYSLIEDLNDDAVNSSWVASWTYGDYDQ
jgi:prepilin-type N-terminal cleavage/methylation domain-containing protein